MDRTEPHVICPSNEGAPLRPPAVHRDGVESLSGDRGISLVRAGRASRIHRAG